MLRVLVLQTLPRPGVFSPNNALLTLARGVDRRRLDLTVAVPRPGRLTEALAGERITVEIVPGLDTYRRGDSWWRLPNVSRRLVRIARERRSQLFVANHAELGPFALRAARRCQLPWLCILRQADRPRRYYQKYRVAEADGIVAVSEAALRSYRDLADRQGLPEVPSRVVPTGIDLPAKSGGPADRPAASDSPAAPPVMGTVGLREVKRPDLLLRAAARLSERHPALRVVLVGAAPDGERQRLRQLASSLGLADRLELPGQQADMGPWYRRLDVYVHTSASEAFPKTVLEAMAHALPVAAFRVGGIAEAVIDGETGLLADPDDLDGLVACVARLLDDRTVARSMGDSGRRRVAEVFSAEAMCRGLTESFLAAAEGAAPMPAASPAGPGR